MTQTPETAPPASLAEIRARLKEIAPAPRMGTPDRARALAKTIAVAALRRNRRHLTPFWFSDDDAGRRLEQESVSVLCYEFATLHLLMAAIGGRGVSVNGLAAEIAGAWDDGGGIGEWLWDHATALGIDPAEVDRLEDAWQALPPSRPGAPEPDASGLESAGEGEEAPEAPAGAVALDRIRDLAESWTEDDGHGAPTLEMAIEAGCGRQVLAILNSKPELSTETTETADAYKQRLDGLFAPIHAEAGRLRAQLAGTSGILGLNGDNLVRWSGATAPGGYVCAVPVTGHPDGICGMPVESEPCTEHRDPSWRPE